MQELQRNSSDVRRLLKTVKMAVSFQMIRKSANFRSFRNPPANDAPPIVQCVVRELCRQARRSQTGAARGASS